MPTGAWTQSYPQPSQLRVYQPTVSVGPPRNLPEKWLNGVQVYTIGD